MRLGRTGRPTYLAHLGRVCPLRELGEQLPRANHPRSIARAERRNIMTDPTGTRRYPTGATLSNKHETLSNGYPGTGLSNHPTIQPPRHHLPRAVEHRALHDTLVHLHVPRRTVVSVSQWEGRAWRAHPRTPHSQAARPQEHRPVPAQMWLGWAQARCRCGIGRAERSLCRCGRGGPSPCADAAGGCLGLLIRHGCAE